MKKLSDLHLKQQVRVLLFFTVLSIMVFGSLYYMSLAKALKEKELGMISNTHTQISTSVEKINDKSRAYGDYMAQNSYVRKLIKAEQDSEKYEYNRILYEILPVITYYDTNIKSIVFFDNQMRMVAFNRQCLSVLDQADADYCFRDVTRTHSGLTRVYQENKDGKGYYCYAKTIFDSGLGIRPEEKIGTCVVVMSADGLRNSLPGWTEERSTYYAVVDERSSIVTSNREELDIAASEALTRIPEGKGEESGKNGLILITPVGDTGWRLISITPNASIYSEIYSLLALGIIFLAFIAAGFLILLRQIQNTIVKPIEKIVAYTDFQKSGGSPREKGELRELVCYMDNLSREIKTVAQALLDTQSRLYEIEISRHKAEYSALQSQINPHFLYNTLDCIKGHAILCGNQEIITITSALSAVMRYCIKGPDFVPVKEEIACIRKYADIISVRFQDRFQISVSVEEECMEVQMPRFLLQPIVENAVYHGLEPKYGRGYLEVNGQISGDAIQFEVWDNGVGMNKEALKLLNRRLEAVMEISEEPSSSGIGLVNTDRRIKMLFGLTYGLQVESVEGEFTKVTVVLPNGTSSQGLIFDGF